MQHKTVSNKQDAGGGATTSQTSQPCEWFIDAHSASLNLTAKFVHLLADTQLKSALHHNSAAFQSCSLALYLCFCPSSPAPSGSVQALAHTQPLYCHDIAVASSCTIPLCLHQYLLPLRLTVWVCPSTGAHTALHCHDRAVVPAGSSCSMRTGAGGGA